MLYDLNIAWTPSTPAADLERTLKTSLALGYSVVALNYHLQPPISAAQSTTCAIPDPSTLPFAQSLIAAPSTTSSSSSSSSSSRTNAAGAATANGKLRAVLRRVTVSTADKAANYRLPTLAAAYDVLALRPTTEDAFNAACTGTGAAADAVSLISLDLAAHLGFHFRPKPCMAAVARGVRFEVCYAQGVGASGAADPRARSLFIGHLAGLVRATRGRGIVVSSEARSALDLRAPADVVNLLAVWGLGPERGAEALGVNPRAVVMNEGLKRSGFRGVVDVVQSAVAPPGQNMKAAAADGRENKKEEGGREKAANGETKSAQQNGGKQGTKRKVVEDGADGTDANGDAKPLSKRQAKKLRRAQQQQQQQNNTIEKKVAS
ncbi:uncharacterized protein E0L32_003338 [Thyridium curvatum]|uniref:Uncharacterized protein n=1 Tax=Thyridium curvatum TaxID=1093900 RepID=A0A507BKI6_9PEZI|nr:uncharacterized protein E0L32_003338 [Thyridium curvatum]TPX17220.1 hypothetical protein E0L32_003338 [Thyridium curvatum]